MSAIESELCTRATFARDYVPGPSLRRRWPAVGRAYGLKRTLTGVSFDAALARMRSRPSLLSTLTPEQWEMLERYDGPEVLGRADGPRRV